MHLLVRSLLCCICLPAVAMSSALTEEQFLSVLDVSHPSLLVLDEHLAEAQARRKEVSVFPNPSISLEREAWGEAAQQTTMALEWTPPLLGGRGPKRAAARHGVEAARHRREEARLAVRHEARAAYAAWWVAAEQAELLSHHARFVGDIAERMRSRAASGEESGLTSRRFALAALRVKAELLRAEVDRGRAEAVIRAWARSPGADLQPLRPGLPEAPAGLSWEDHPRVLALRGSVERAHLERKAAGGVFAFPSLQFGWIWQDNDDAGVDGALAGLSWSLPLFDRHQAEKTRAQGSLVASRAELEMGEARARAELPAAVDAYQAVRASALEAWDVTQDLDSLIQAALASFQAEERTDTDLLEILDSTLEARLSALDLYTTALAAHRRLEEAAGRPLTQGASR